MKPNKFAQLPQELRDIFYEDMTPSSAHQFADTGRCYRREIHQHLPKIFPELPENYSLLQPKAERQYSGGLLKVKQSWCLVQRDDTSGKRLHCQVPLSCLANLEKSYIVITGAWTFSCIGVVNARFRNDTVALDAESLLHEFFVNLAELTKRGKGPAVVKWKAESNLFHWPARLTQPDCWMRNMGWDVGEERNISL